MRAITAPKAILELTAQLKKNSRTIGLVPTMGALHDGHLALIDRSILENDATIVSIFINPLQFDRQEDFDSYPRSIAEDKKMLKARGVDFVFEPSNEVLYATRPDTSISFGDSEHLLEGKYRPGHFGGVGIVVSKLFHLINPDRAYFGLKDLQQFILIKNMVRDLSFPVEVVGIETVREKSGLAMSSRNKRLTNQGYEIAANIYKGLSMAKNEISEKKDLEEVKANLTTFYESIAGLEIEYLEFVNVSNLKTVETRNGELAVCVAAFVEGVRLIDNLYLRAQ